MLPATTTQTSRWAHQQAAFEFVEKLWRTGRRGTMLAMDMGTGKTRVAVDLTTAFDLPLILILCPLRVVEVWRQQFRQYAHVPYEFLPLDDRAGSVQDKARRAKEMLSWALARGRRLAIAINYESARSEPFAHWALANVWPLVIADESHRLKQASGRASRFASRLTLRSRYRLALTGTPMAHEPIDIWAQFRFLDPTILDPTFGSFKLRHAVMGGYFNKEIKGWRDLDELKRKFYTIAFRVTNEVLDLPPELDQSLYATLSPRAARVYRDMEEHLIAELESGLITAANALVRLLRLQQITGGTVTDDSLVEHQIDTAKEDALTDFLSDLDPTEPVAVFARFKSDLRAIHRAATKAGLCSGELSGDHDDLAAWQRGAIGDPTILAVQIQAGGIGVDLTRARYAVYYSMGFSLTDYLQSRARVRRPPQTRPVTYYHILVTDSIDETVLRAVLARQDLIHSTLEEVKCLLQRRHT
jgi:SNF2 family DNA or RNA helicase